MKAAVVTDLNQPPSYEDFKPPETRADEVVVDVTAAALSQLVRAQASGRHYSSGAPPFVPGADGVGRLDGRRVYFAFPRAPNGAMGERVAVPRANVIDVPEGIDDVQAAAIANPGMSSWAALTRRAGFKAGESVLVNGATGASGRLAIAIARHLGASRIVATGRRPAAEAMISLGADEYIALEDDENNPDECLDDRIRQTFAAGVDVVLDYLWGAPAAALLAASTGHGDRDAATRLRFVNIGSMAGKTLDLPAGALRSSGVELMGSGLGSLSHAELLESIAGVLDAAAAAKLSIDARAVRLAEVAEHWAQDSSARQVFVIDR